MKSKVQSNLTSPNNVKCPCDLTDLNGWLQAEVAAVQDEAVRKVVLDVEGNIDSFVRWPSQAILLWSGCTRTVKFHRFPEVMKSLSQYVELASCPDLATFEGFSGLDNRSNGPAVVAFRVAGGTRPNRFGSSNDWSIHHLYSGKFPYPGRDTTLHAVKHGLHFTQSAGLVAIHPIADQMCDEFPFFAWFLRATSFLKFDYDPDEVFSAKSHDKYGFVGKTCMVVPVAAEQEE